MPEFLNFTHTVSNGTSKIKPVLISIVDGGPDENPRYDKVIRMNVHHFLKFNLDAVFIAWNSPGRSAYNRVERRMAPLSRALAGIILPYDHYGTHLDNQGNTIDDDLEKRNFSYAGKALAELWSESVIDGHITIAEYVDPDCSEIQSSSILTKDVKWCDRHVFQSQYLLQILKCSDINCCGERRSSLFTVLSSGWLPPPISLQQTVAGLKLVDIADIKSYASLFVTLAIDLKQLTDRTNIVYDSYCPSVQSMLDARTCSCKKYFSSISSMKMHLKGNKYCKKPTKVIQPVQILGTRANETLALMRYDNEHDVEWVPTEELEDTISTISKETEPDSISIICDIKSIFSPIWENV